VQILKLLLKSLAVALNAILIILALSLVKPDKHVSKILYCLLSLLVLGVHKQVSN
jgi:hypothetical protein